MNLKALFKSSFAAPSIDVAVSPGYITVIDRCRHSPQFCAMFLIFPRSCITLNSGQWQQYSLVKNDDCIIFIQVIFQNMGLIVSWIASRFRCHHWSEI